MPDRDLPLSHDAFHLHETARLFGWEVIRQADESLLMSLLDWKVRAVFSHDGAFRYARAEGPESADAELTLQEVLDVLEEYGTASPPAPPP